MRPTWISTSKRWLVAAILIVAGCLFSPSRAPNTAGDLPPAEARALWDHITRTDPYRNWGLHPLRPGLYASLQRGLVPAHNPHGAYLKLYGNATALQGLREAENLPLPNGAVLILEDFAKDKTTLLSLTVMLKVDGYHPDGGDWFWARYEPDGRPVESGKLESCMGCHIAQRAHDWRYVGAAPHRHP